MSSSYCRVSQGLFSNVVIASKSTKYSRKRDELRAVCEAHQIHITEKAPEATGGWGRQKTPKSNIRRKNQEGLSY